MTALRVVIVDDQELLRRGLRMLLETADGIDVVGEAEHGARALTVIPHAEPDLVLADARMPEMDGEELIRRCRKNHPGLPVLVLTTFDDAHLVRALMDAGAAGILLKDLSTEALAEGIRQAVRGHLVVDPRLARIVYGREPAPAAGAGPELTSSERAVAELVAVGASNSEIADRLSLAHGTVKNTVSVLLRKFDVRDRTVLALRLARELDPPTS